MGFPPATAFYLSFYALTLLIHVVFINYVLGGSVYMLAAGWLDYREGDPERENVVASVLRDWMPFALGLAITAGVAPLLFVQVLYQIQFYTANLLLFHRWMAILPVLMVAFYLVYFSKTRLAQRLPHVGWVVLSGVIFAGFLFIAFSWTENHVLSCQPAGEWKSFYVSKRWFFQDREVLPRVALWLVGSVSNMITLVSWQLLCMQFSQAQKTELEVKRLSILAMATLVLAVVCGGIYLMVLSPETRQAVFGPLARIYLLAAGAGVVMQLAAWASQMRYSRFRAAWLVLASVGGVLMTLGVIVAREAVRLASFTPEQLKALLGQHARVETKGGFVCFLFFFLVNAAFIAGAIYLVKRNKMFARN
ncbi:MAG: hypothetical protein PHV34_21385 [Verrucomicrobiae bacterium]|nr:hypothetical protein [Verrucomicrobiae bacterium]